MDDLIIFTSVPTCISVAFIAIIHVLCAVVSTLERKKLPLSPILITSILEGIGIILHLFALIFGFIKGASIEEMLLVLMISGAFGIVSMGVAERRSQKKTDGKE